MDPRPASITSTPKVWAARCRERQAHRRQRRISHSDINGTFNGVVDLANKLSASAQVEACVVTQWFRFGYGRGEDDADQCTLEALNKVFETGDFKDLLIALTQTDAFLYRSNGQGGAP
jgi:hypothetical protein